MVEETIDAEFGSALVLCNCKLVLKLRHML